jgi:aspartyl protease family protein
MKKLLSVLVVVAGVSLTPLPSHSQEYSGCFLRHGNGQVINLSTLCGSGSGQATTAPAPSGVFRIPIKRREGGTPVIDVVFNGKYRFEMLFDTGATGTIISPQMAKAIGIKIQGMALAQTAGGTVQNPVGRVPLIQVGGIAAKNLLVAINPHLELGLLGQNFYGHHDVTIKADVIEFHIRK